MNLRTKGKRESNVEGVKSDVILIARKHAIIKPTLSLLTLLTSVILHLIASEGASLFQKVIISEHDVRILFNNFISSLRNVFYDRLHQLKVADG